MDLIATSPNVAPIQLSLEFEFFKVFVEVRVVSFVLCAETNLVNGINRVEKRFNLGPESLPFFLRNFVSLVCRRFNRSNHALYVVNHPDRDDLICTHI